jgi:hypothetical protein
VVKTWTVVFLVVVLCGLVGGFASSGLSYVLQTVSSYHMQNSSAQDFLTHKHTHHLLSFSNSETWFCKCRVCSFRH